MNQTETPQPSDPAVWLRAADDAEQRAIRGFARYRDGYRVLSVSHYDLIAHLRAAAGEVTRLSAVRNALIGAIITNANNLDRLGAQLDNRDVEHYAYRLRMDADAALLADSDAGAERERTEGA